MVSAVRRGTSFRAVARRFRVSLRTVQVWVARAQGQRLDRVDWTTRPPGRRAAINRTSPRLEARILALRHELQQHDILGEFGAAAIRDALLANDPHRALPTVRTIGRILVRHGALDHRRRLRRPPPPPGWHLPAVLARHADVDLFDVIEDLKLADGPLVDVLTGVALHGGLPAAWPLVPASTTHILPCLVAHWRTYGLPAYAQFDNDTIFQGAHQHGDSISPVMRLCLSLGIVPVFAPPREPGFQATIESFNGCWQAKVWARCHHDSLETLRERSARYITALRQRRAPRIDAAPPRRPFPADWQLDLQAHPRGLLLYVRRTSEHGTVSLLGRSFPVDPHWTHRLVRCEVDLNADLIRCYALRRWVSRRLGLIAVLPALAEETVRAGTLPAQAAMKYLVPLARANRGQCERLVENLGRQRLSVRQIARLYAGWRAGNADQRQVIVERPLLYLELEEKQAAPAAPADPGTEREQRLLRDLGLLAAICRRVREALREREQDLPWPTVRRYAWQEAHAGFAAVIAVVVEGGHA